MLLDKPEKIRPSERTRHSWEDNIKIELREIDVKV
jgi:hypothetical protein